MARLFRSSTPFDELFNEFSKGFWVQPVGMPGNGEVDIKLDVSESDKAFIVRADIPGVKKEDIHVDIDGELVTLQAEAKQEKEEQQGGKVLLSERSYGMMSRSFTLPSEVEAQGAKAEYKDGVLNLTLPKKKAASASHRIAIS